MIKIVTDSAADLPAAEADELGITVAPLSINFPEGEIKSSEISPDDFYNRLEAMQPKTPTTSQPSAGSFADIYRELLQTNQEILSIHISSGLSGTVSSAVTAAKEVGEKLVHVVDSLTLSGGERFQVLAAARALKSGWSLAEVVERLKQIRLATEVVYTLDTLTYLARGGRIGRVQALAGALLNLKPIINVDKADGKYNNSGRARTIRKAMQEIASHLQGLYGKQQLWVSVMHGRYQEKADELADMLRDGLNVGRLEILRISPVLGVHTGPSIVGATVVPMKLLEEIG
jgi:DegV family protein with EDD domain